MNTSTFDARGTVSRTQDPEVPPVLPSDDDTAGLSTIDLLRAKAGEVVEFPDFVFDNPKGTIRFTCATNITQKQLTSWQRAAMPVTARKRGGAPDLSKLDPIIYFTRAIAAQCVLVEVRSRSTAQWQPITHNRTGEPLTFDDPELLTALGGLDRTVAVRNAMNGAEWAIQEKGTELLAAAGYGERDEDDDEDPPA